jgi:hypothetical protein
VFQKPTRKPPPQLLECARAHLSYFRVRKSSGTLLFVPRALPKLMPKMGHLAALAPATVAGLMLRIRYHCSRR